MSSSGSSATANVFSETINSRNSSMDENDENPLQQIEITEWQIRGYAIWGDKFTWTSNLIYIFFLGCKVVSVIELPYRNHQSN